MRAVWKGPFVDNKVLNDIYSSYKISNNKKPLKLLSRSSMVFPSFVGLNFLVFNGLKFISLSINEQMVGHKFGEFIMTKKHASHKKAR
jgi:small subunit ribosomal protein S19